MDNDGSFGFSLFIDISQIKSLWEIEINLTGRKLMSSTDSILKHKIQFGTIKSRLSRHFLIIESSCVADVLECCFGYVSYLIWSEIRFVWSSQTQRHSISLQHTHRTIKLLDDRHDRLYLSSDLRWSTKKMSIVLGNSSDTCQSS